MHISTEEPAEHAAAPIDTNGAGEPQTAPADAEAAYLRLADAIEAIPAAEVLGVNLNIRRTAARVLGAMPRLRALEPQMRNELRNFDPGVLDRAADAALACLYLAAIRRPARSGADFTRALAAEARALRTKLRRAAQYLADSELLDARKVAAVPRQAGNLRTAQDLLGLVALLREAWPVVGERVLVDAEELDRATVVGAELVRGLGARLQPGFRDEERARAGERLARAFTLMVRAYGECRRLVTFVRWWEGNAGEVAPSLFGKGVGRRRGGRVGGEGGQGS